MKQKIITKVSNEERKPCLRQLAVRRSHFNSKSGNARKTATRSERPKVIYKLLCPVKHLYKWFLSYDLNSRVNLVSLAVGIVVSVYLMCLSAIYSAGTSKTPEQLGLTHQRIQEQK